MTVEALRDLVILQATPGGITAAIEAARLGKTSIILERTAFIGGLPANGLGATDIATRGATGGLFLEFVRRIKAYYVSTYGADSIQATDCSEGYRFEPRVAEQIFHAWLAEYPQIKIVTRRQFDFEPENVQWEGDEISAILVTNLETNQVETVPGRFFLDASYEGDLIAAAGVPFFVGREGVEEYNEIGAGRLYKLWNGPECAGSTHAGDNAVQAFNYRLCVTDDPHNRAPIKRPENYNRVEFVSLIHDVRSGLHTGVDVLECTEEMVAENLKRADHNELPVPHKLDGIRRLLSNCKLPNAKWDGNNQHFAFISTDLPEENWPYPTSSWAWRDAFAKRLREYTEGLLHFAQTDEALPQWFRDACSQWGWAADEYVENGHFPRQLYVREGRRMKGKYIFTANDMHVLVPRHPDGVVLHDGTTKGRVDNNSKTRRPSVQKDSITSSHYALDSHAVRKREPGRVHLDGFFSYRCTPYPVPYGVIVPDAPVRNLLAPVPVSATHIGFSTLRMEPCWMALGQAAGVAACLALDAGVAAEHVSIEKLQQRLLDEGAVLAYDKKLWAPGIDDEARKAMQSEMLQASGSIWATSSH